MLHLHASVGARYIYELRVLTDVDGRVMQEDAVHASTTRFTIRQNDRVVVIFNNRSDNYIKLI